MKSKTIIIIAGPTAIGKTSMAMEVARHFNTQIISADSRQCYRELTIGTAKPAREQLQLVKHYFVNTHSIHLEVNAAAFEQYALNAIREIFVHNDMAVMVGGTGLYIKAFAEGLDEIPPVSPEIRIDIMANYEQSGIRWLQEQVCTRDPVYFSTGEMQNPQRLIRALEVKMGTGKSIREFQQRKSVDRDFNIIKIGLDLPKDQLHQNIYYRVDQMMNLGLLQEVEALLKFNSLPVLRTVGYTEIFQYLKGRLTLDQAILLIKKNTRHYAKRQLTWFRKDKAIKWCSPGDIEKVVHWSQTFPKT